jgi:hypothetical protein
MPNNDKINELNYNYLFILKKYIDGIIFAINYIYLEDLGRSPNFSLEEPR